MHRTDTALAAVYVVPFKVQNRRCQLRSTFICSRRHFSVCSCGHRSHCLVYWSEWCSVKSYLNPIISHFSQIGCWLAVVVFYLFGITFAWNNVWIKNCSFNYPWFDINVVVLLSTVIRDVSCASVLVWISQNPFEIIDFAISFIVWFS